MPQLRKAVLTGCLPQARTPVGKQAKDKSARKERAESRLGRLLAVAIVP
jgi:hypothetical protein